MKLQDFSIGAMAAWPICLGYIPIGLAFGVLAQKTGLTPGQIGLMSLIVFAGSSQFIAVSMLSAGASTISIIAATFVVNLRHFLMSSSLSLYLGGVNKKLLSLFSYGITDESFAINYSRFKSGTWGIKPAFALNQSAYIAWFLSTVCGGFFGQFIPAKAFGIDYALTAMFICLLVYQVKEVRHAITALAAGLIAVGLSIWIPGNSYIVVASILAATFGTLLGKWTEKEPTNGK